MTTETTPPVQLRKSLIEQARIVGSVEKRGISEQIEYWADIGRKVSDTISRADLIDVDSGLMRISIEKAEVPYIDPDAFFAALDADRKSGKLASDIAKLSPVRYQVCEDKPGLFERIDESGNVVVGQFVDDEFRPVAAK